MHHFFKVECYVFDHFYIYIAQISFLTTWKSSFSIIIYKKRNILKVHNVVQMDGRSRGRMDRYTLVDVQIMVKVSARILLSYNCFFYVTNAPKIFNCEFNSLLFRTFLTHYVEGFLPKIRFHIPCGEQKPSNFVKSSTNIAVTVWPVMGIRGPCFSSANKLYLQAKKKYLNKILCNDEFCEETS